MNLSVGIVGLPNVGKSTLFNALLKRQAALAANYPFATIEPNIGVVPVPDERLEKLAELTKTEFGMAELPPLKQALVEFVDIAGLVKGAAEGAGLGNKFLSHIREVNVVAHVVRVFEDPDVIKEGAVDPKSDYLTIRTELALADLQTIEKINEKALRTDSLKREAVEKIKRVLDTGLPAQDILLTVEEREKIKEINLLSTKREIIVLNVMESEYSEEKIPSITKKYANILGLPESKFVVISAKIESELSDLSSDEAREYLRELGLSKSGLERLIQKAYQELGLISFLTAGEKEVRAWTTRMGASAVDAAGEIHTDFMKKFIKAEVIAYEHYTTLGGRKKAREVGKARLEGKDYIVKDGDVIEFKIGA